MNGVRATTAMPVASGAQFDLLMARMRDQESEAKGAEAGKLAGQGELREKFQDFVAGTFYKTMLKALREGQKPAKYFHGGQTENVFQQHLDQIVTDDLARTHGEKFSGSLFKAFSQQMNLPAEQPGPGTQEAGHVVDVAV